MTTADAVADALAVVELSLPDMILSDTRLPTEDGFRLVEVLRERGLDDLPFMFLSSDTSLESKVRGLEYGVEYLTKPIYIKEVITRVNLELQRRQREGLGGTEARARFTGSLSDMGLVDLLQTVDIGKKSGVLRLNSGHTDGVVYFQKGRVIDAVTNHRVGESAVYRFLVWNDGGFQADFLQEIDRPERIQVPTQALLMEGMRRVDEWGRLLEQLPPLTSVFEVDGAELVARLAEIPDEINDILRHFDGENALLDVVDRAGTDDLELLESISKLFFEGLIVDTGRIGRSESVLPPGVPEMDDAVVPGEPDRSVLSDQLVPLRAAGAPDDLRAPPTDPAEAPLGDVGAEPAEPDVGLAPNYKSAQVENTEPPREGSDGLDPSGGSEETPSIEEEEWMARKGKRRKKSRDLQVEEAAQVVGETNIEPERVEEDFAEAANEEAKAAQQSNVINFFPRKSAAQRASGSVAVNDGLVESEDALERGDASTETREADGADRVEEAEELAHEVDRALDDAATDAPRRDTMPDALKGEHRDLEDTISDDVPDAEDSAAAAEEDPDELPSEESSAEPGPESPSEEDPAALRSAEEPTGPLGEDVEVPDSEDQARSDDAEPPTGQANAGELHASSDGSSRREKKKRGKKSRGKNRQGRGKTKAVEAAQDSEAAQGPEAAEGSSAESSASPRASSSATIRALTDTKDEVAAGFFRAEAYEAAQLEENWDDLKPVSEPLHEGAQRWRVVTFGILGLAVVVIGGMWASEHVFGVNPVEVGGATPSMPSISELELEPEPEGSELAAASDVEPESDSEPPSPSEGLGDEELAEEPSEEREEEAEVEELAVEESAPDEELAGEEALEEEALEEEVAAAEPTPGSYDQLLEEAQRLRGRRAEEAYRTALAANPEGAVALTELSLLLMNRFQNDEAAELAQRAVAADPGLAKGWLALGGARQMLRDQAGAQEAFRACADSGGEARWVAECRRNIR